MTRFTVVWHQKAKPRCGARERGLHRNLFRRRNAGFYAGGNLNGPISAAAYLFDNGTSSANLSGTGSLTKSTSDTATLSGINTYSGGRVVNAGRLIIASSGPLPVGGSLTVGAGGTLVFNGLATGPVETSVTTKETDTPETEAPGATDASPTANTVDVVTSASLVVPVPVTPPLILAPLESAPEAWPSFLTPSAMKVNATVQNVPAIG